jgi:hypothetical protein
MVIAYFDGPGTVSSFTHVANSAANGSGDVETANVDWLCNSYGDIAYIVFTNNAAHTVYITSAYITGYITGGTSNLSAEKSDAGSALAYGERMHEYSGGFISSMAEANNYCTHFLALCHDPHPSIVLKLIASSNLTLLNDALTRDISDRVNIYADATATSLGVDASFFIEHIWHQLTRDHEHYCWLTCGQVVSDTWAAEATSYTSAVANEVLVSPGGIGLGGKARVRKDVEIPLPGLGKGVADPTTVYIGNYMGYEFAVNDQIYYCTGVPHDWDESEPIYFEIHWYIEEGDITKYVTWELWYTACKEDSTEAVDWDSDPVASGDIAIPATTKYMNQTMFAIPANALAHNDVVGIRLKRVAAQGDAPTAKPVVVGAMLEYVAHTFGEAL